MVSAMSDSPRIPAARSTLGILRFLAGRSGPVPASTIARELALPRSSVYQLIAVMMDEGFVVHYPEDHAYGLSSLVSEIGTSALQSERLARLTKPMLDRLVRDLKLPVVAHLAVLSGADVVYAARVQGFRAPTTVSAIGVRLPAHLTATGRAMLALLPAGQVRALFPSRAALIRRHDAGPSSLRELDALLAATRARGWAVEEGDVTAEYGSVGASALDRNGYPVAAIGLTFRIVAMDAAGWTSLGEAARRTADALTARLAGRG